MGVLARNNVGQEVDKLDGVVTLVEEEIQTLGLLLCASSLAVCLTT